MVILHGSDLQFGKPYRPWAGDAFVVLAHRIRPDLVVVAGDLTQRAKTREYAEARRLLETLAPLPVVVTPGNHDVPLYRVWERLVDPYRNWRRAVSQELDSVTLSGVTDVRCVNVQSDDDILVGTGDGRVLRFNRELVLQASATLTGPVLHLILLGLAGAGRQGGLFIVR